MPEPSPGSREVSWWPVHEFVARLLEQACTLPTAGTPAWCALSGGDPRKLLAVAVAGEHHVLRIETAQAALTDASHAISTAADWANIGRETRQRTDFYAARPWLKRASAHLQPQKPQTVRTPAR